MSLAHDLGPETDEPALRGSTTCRLRLADESPTDAVETGDPLEPASFDPEALARRDTKAWQDALIVTTPGQRARGGDPGHLMLLLLLSLLLWLERPAAPAPRPDTPVASTPPATETAADPAATDREAALAHRRLDVEQAEPVVLSALPREAAPYWTEPFAAGAFLALAAAVFALVRTQASPWLALLASIACVVQVSARPPEWPGAGLALGTIGFAVVAARGAAVAWKTGVIGAMVLITALTAPAVGAALLGAWAFEAAIARRSNAAFVRGAAAFAPLFLAGAGLPSWGGEVTVGGASPNAALGALLLLLAVPGAGVLCARGAWLPALAPVLLLAACGGGAVEPALMTPFVAVAAAAALDAVGRVVLARLEPARRGVDALARSVRGPRPAPVS